MTDYAIARRIVDLHSNIEENVARVYTPEEIQRYILFSRQLKPILNNVSFNFLLSSIKGGFPQQGPDLHVTVFPVQG